MKRESVDSTVPVLAASYFPSKIYAFSLNLFFLALFRGSGQTKCTPLHIQQTNQVWLRVLAGVIFILFIFLILKCFQN